MSYQFTPLQLLWLDTLEKHPERQLTGKLGYGNAQDYKACCLGQLLICSYEIENKPIQDLFNTEGFVEDSRQWTGTLYDSGNRFGIFNGNGELRELFFAGEKVYESLSQMNDSGMSWPEIAKYICENPENVFHS